MASKKIKSDVQKKEKKEDVLVTTDRFMDKDTHVIYEAGQDVSHLTEERINELQNLGLIKDDK